MNEVGNFIVCYIFWNSLVVFIVRNEGYKEDIDFWILF